MKTFEPHAILRSPLTSDETVEALIETSLICSKGGRVVMLLIDPPFSLTPRNEPSSQGLLPGLEKPV